MNKSGDLDPSDGMVAFLRPSGKAMEGMPLLRSSPRGCSGVRNQWLELSYIYIYVHEEINMYVFIYIYIDFHKLYIYINFQKLYIEGKYIYI